MDEKENHIPGPFVNSDSTHLAQVWGSAHMGTDTDRQTERTEGQTEKSLGS